MVGICPGGIWSGGICPGGICEFFFGPRTVTIPEQLQIEQLINYFYGQKRIYIYTVTVIVFCCYFFSESSLFLSKNRFILKTCGRTILLEAILPLLDLVNKYCPNFIVEVDTGHCIEYRS